MAFDRPKLSTLIDRAKTDIETRLPEVTARLSRSFESVIARVHAGGAHGLYGHIAWAALQAIPDTAESEFMARWASIFGLTRDEAVAAEGTVQFTGSAFAIIPLGTEVENDDGVKYKTDAAGMIMAGIANIDITASAGGDDGNLGAGGIVSLLSPIAGVDSDATADSDGLVGGLDTETDAALLSRLLSHLQTPPKGGGPGDYVNWALDVTGVTRAWEYPNMLGAGTVGVSFVRDNDAGGVIPDAGEVTDVQDAIDAVCPVTADVTVFAPTGKALDLTIALTPDTADVRAAVEDEISDMLSRDAEPGATIYLSRINEAISIAAGETDHVLSVPAADVTHTTYEMAITGTITWV